MRSMKFNHEQICDVTEIFTRAQFFGYGSIHRNQFYISGKENKQIYRIPLVPKNKKTVLVMHQGRFGKGVSGCQLSMIWLTRPNSHIGRLLSPINESRGEISLVFMAGLRKDAARQRIRQIKRKSAFLN